MCASVPGHKAQRPPPVPNPDYEVRIPPELPIPAGWGGTAGLGLGLTASSFVLEEAPSFLAVEGKGGEGAAPNSGLVWEQNCSSLRPAPALLCFSLCKRLR